MRTLVLVGAIMAGVLGGGAGAAAQTTSCTGYTDPQGYSSIRCVDDHGFLRGCGVYQDSRNTQAQNCADAGTPTSCVVDPTGLYMCFYR
ncbi:MAG TPA: hypothetical protein VII06_38495 [Chloroflexota bacterium]|jgi:hypothetical protein